ncbi:MAG: hypothetical protein ACE5I9_00430 [Candidatus Methylomirabilales bacterium]
MAKPCEYRWTGRRADKLDEALHAEGPTCLVVEVETTSTKGLPWIDIGPPGLVARFREAVRSRRRA